MAGRQLPIAIIGAGPVGLAAAAHLVLAGEEPLVLEAGRRVGASILEWGHVRLFSPWSFNIDQAAATLLDRHGWVRPAAGDHPTGGELVSSYLAPLAATSELAPRIKTGSRVRFATRAGHDLMKNGDRSQAPFLLRMEDGEGEHDVLARAVIDASGTWSSPNPAGVAGIPAIGETAAADRIFHRIPDVLGAHRARYAGRRVLVIGSGHSAFNTVGDLVALAALEPGTQVHWAVRRSQLGDVFGGGEHDALAERGRLGDRVRRLVESGAVTLHTGVAVDRIAGSAGGLTVFSGGRRLVEVDEIVAATGFRPDRSMTSELRLALDPAVESPAILAPLIDPNVHSCGTVPPHGAAELTHPEEGFYVVGMKSYGRAPTALMLTGYEQVRSVVAALTGDWERARRVELVLPETGVCSWRPEPAPDGVGEPAEATAAACCG